MKIGFVLDDTLDKPDGVQQYVLSLGHWMETVGHEVHYLVGESHRHDLRHLHSLSKNINVRFNQNRMSIPRPANKKVINELLQREKFDVLHVQMPYSPMLGARIINAAPKETKVVATFHILPFSKLEIRASKMLRRFERRSLKRLDDVVAVSAPAAIFAKKAFKVKAAVLPNVVPLHEYQHAKRLKKYEDGKIVIAFLGRLVERKGCMYLLKALNELQDKHGMLNVRVIIGGKGPMLGQLKSYVKNHHLSQHVQFVGFIKEADKPDFLASAHIAVFPSTGGESFGIVLIEAMAAGSEVVIGGNNPGYRSVLGEKPSQLVNPKDTAAFAKTLKHYITSGAARKTAHRWQSKHVQQYDVHAVGAQLIDLYKAPRTKS